MYMFVFLIKETVVDDVGSLGNTSLLCRNSNYRPGVDFALPVAVGHGGILCYIVFLEQEWSF